MGWLADYLSLQCSSNLLTNYCNRKRNFPSLTFWGTVIYEHFSTRKTELLHKIVSMKWVEALSQTNTFVRFCFHSLILVCEGKFGLCLTSQLEQNAQGYFPFHKIFSINEVGVKYSTSSLPFTLPDWNI